MSQIEFWRDTFDAFDAADMCSCWDCWPITLGAFLLGGWTGMMALAMLANAGTRRR